MQLREYQKNIIQETRAFMQAGVKNVLIQSPTGSGKTVLTAHMLKTASSKGLTSWFICHRRELIKQSILAFSDTGVNHGIISSGWADNKNLPIQIASIQTLIRRYKNYKKPNLIVWDECAHCASKTWAKIHKENPQAYHIGLTATPQRLDGAGLKDYFQVIVPGLSIQELTEQGYLAKYKLFAPSKVNTSKIHTRMGDFVKSEIESLIDKPTITGDAIKHYKKLCMGKRALVFCASIKHSEHVVDNFVNAGIKACHLDGESQKGYRDLMLDKFRKGEIQVISNVDLFGEGFDLPTLEAVIMLRPTQSLSLFLQQCGRALRPSPGKEYAIILDHAGNTERHGLPDEDREWTLEGNKGNKQSSEKQVKVKTCPKCYAVQISGGTSCDFCGYVYEIKERDIAHVDGELVEVDYEKLRKQKRQAQGRCETKEELIQLGIKRGYKRPRLWAMFIWNARQRKLRK